MKEYRLDNLTIKEHLLELAERGNKSFAESLNPGVEHVLGTCSTDFAYGLGGVSAYCRYFLYGRTYVAGDGIRLYQT